ncbi:pantothenate kinase [Thermosporothrix hazakensis]|jgi:type I pantothenate kinase|uniref:Pantothenate kinase n=2 Tax=Thermosporothrix TaxID=768650 RepID=A0A326UFD6_THEHA|nr:type I pantothenate kinase [Thermosporothrix hazakensis]PZW25619.1 pantothenate kinase [Thermosporothrix hazakensis]BBH89914.1 pantothenate kinase [Thermosporothrix sp. COM3]GCE48114.1 pantothenate kinase [Thermosporothrix hazakensis]
MNIIANEHTTELSRFIVFSREEWAQRRANTPLTLSEERLNALRSLNDRISLAEVEHVYLPLSRLLNLYVGAVQKLHAATSTFLGHTTAQVPYVIGIAGSVAVGKSTTARLLQALLSDWPSRPHVELVTTDGFLYPNRILEERGLMNKKGFPESYDQRRLLRFMADVKSGMEEVTAPIYSHLTYDIVPDQMQVIRRPDILIVEGLNVLQSGKKGRSRKGPRFFVSDFFDFSIYVDADEAHIEQWYIERFLTLRETAFRDPSSFFRHFTQLSLEESIHTARSIWQEINGLNLRENILPTRERAHLILKKGANHLVQEVWLRKL